MGHPSTQQPLINHNCMPWVDFTFFQMTCCFSDFFGETPTPLIKNHILFKLLMAGVPDFADTQNPLKSSCFMVEIRMDLVT